MLVGELLLADLAHQVLPGKSLKIVVAMNTSISSAVDKLKLVVTHIIHDWSFINCRLFSSSAGVWQGCVRAQTAEIHVGRVETFVDAEAAGRAIVKAVSQVLRNRLQRRKREEIRLFG